MKTTLSVLSLLSIIFGVFWSVYAIANGYRVIGGDPSYCLPQAVKFLASGIIGWAVFGELAKIMGRLDAIEHQSASS